MRLTGYMYSIQSYAKTTEVTAKRYDLILTTLEKPHLANNVCLTVYAEETMSHAYATLL